MIYLDAGATTLQKPPAVAFAVQSAMRRMATPGRGGHPPAMRAADAVYDCRCLVGALFGAQPEQVVFTMNATHGLNIAINSLVQPGTKVLVSGYEHNSVTRPLTEKGAEIRVASSPLFDSRGILAAFEKELPWAELVVCTHVSNVFGCVQPVEELAGLCRRTHTPLIVDASQSAGILPVLLADWGAAFVAMPGHKGLYGPQGTGLLLCGAEASPLLYGGTGSASRRQTMPIDLPDRLEAGTHNMPGIAGLLEGLRFVSHAGVERIAQWERRLTRRAEEGLARLPGVEVFADKTGQGQTGVLSFCVKGMDCEQVGEELARRQIAVRAGLHCAPLAHRTAGTLESGTIRISPSVFNTEGQINLFLREMREILRENTKKSV